MRTTRKFPYLSNYLERLDQEAGRAMVASVPVSTWILAALLIPLWLGMAEIGVSFFVIGVFLSVIGAGAVALAAIAAVQRKRRLAADPREQRRRSVFQASHEFRELEIHRRLHRWMDPVALHLLEAGAYHWSRIQTTLNGPQWGPRDLPVYWLQLKQQVEEAAREGMYDLVLLARNCVGPPQKDREADIKGIFESFVDLDIADALQGLKTMAKTDWTAYAHQSPQAQAVAVHGRLIAERLRDLADDVEAKSSEIAVHTATSGGLQSLEALDGVLSELRTVRQAESELEQRIGSEL